jgi:hypothetical protein
MASWPNPATATIVFESVTAQGNAAETSTNCQTIVFRFDMELRFSALATLNHSQRLLLTREHKASWARKALTLSAADAIVLFSRFSSAAVSGGPEVTTLHFDDFQFREGHWMCP